MISPSIFALFVMLLVGFTIGGFAFDHAAENTGCSTKYARNVLGFRLCLVGVIVSGGLTIAGVLLIMLGGERIVIEFSILGGSSSFFCFALTLWLSFVGIGATHADIGPEKNRNTRVTANPRTILFTPDQTFAGNIDGFLIGVMVFIGLVIIVNLLGSTGLYVYELIQLIGRCR